MIVYVCSPYGTKEKELEKVRTFCQNELELGNVPFAPQLIFPQIFDEDVQAGEYALLGLEMLSRMDALHVYGKRRGAYMQQEIAHAESMAIPVICM